MGYTRNGKSPFNVLDLGKVPLRIYAHCDCGDHGFARYKVSNLYRSRTIWYQGQSLGTSRKRRCAPPDIDRVKILKQYFYKKT